MVDGNQDEGGRSGTRGRTSGNNSVLLFVSLVVLIYGSAKGAGRFVYRFWDFCLLFSYLGVTILASYFGYQCFDDALKECPYKGRRYGRQGSGNYCC